MRLSAVGAPLDAAAHLDFLATLTNAPDCATASAVALTRLIDAAAATAGVVFLPDDDATLVARATRGLDAEVRDPLSIADEAHPLVIAARTMSVMSSDTDARQASLPFASWLALPLPRAGQSPGGVIVLDVPAPAAERLVELSRLAGLAGPVLAQLAAGERARSEADSHRLQRERLRSMIDALPDPIVITDASHAIVVQNARADELLSVRDGDSAARRRVVEINTLLFATYLSSANGGDGELTLVDPGEDRDILFEVLARPLSGATVLAVLRDVTDLRRAVSELERHVQRLRSAELDATRERDRLNLILENVADPIVVTDGRSNVILMNDQAERLFELPATPPVDAQQRRTHVRAVRGNDTWLTAFIADFAAAAEGSRRADMTLTRPDSGEALPMEVVSGKVRDEYGEPIAIVSVFHDLTKQMENAGLYEELQRSSVDLKRRVREATADLAEQNAKLQWQAQEVERANTLKSEFLASMSHELRTPINAVLGHTANLIDGIYGQVAPAQDEMLKRVRGAANHLLALINDILDLARIEAGKMPLRIETVHLRAVITELAQQVEPMVRKKGLSYVSEVSDECAPLVTDRTKLKQVLLNLLSNAIKFTQRGGITVRVTPAGNAAVRIAVADTGIGIRPKDLELIWEDFRQVDQTLIREHGGTGLGLSITRKLLHRLGGTVALESEYGRGTTFTVTLPLRIQIGEESPAELVGQSAR